MLDPVLIKRSQHWHQKWKFAMLDYRTAVYHLNATEVRKSALKRADTADRRMQQLEELSMAQGNPMGALTWHVVMTLPKGVPYPLNPA